MSLTRDEIFRQAAAKLRQDFRERDVIPHNQLKGDEAADLVRHFLNDHLPKRFNAGSGFIIDARDQVSRQTDVLIYDALNCPVYRASETAGIYPSDNVPAVIEVKSVLNKASLRDAHDKIVAAKSLVKAKPAIDAPGLTLSHTLGCVFAFDSDITLERLAEHDREFMIESGLGMHIDYVAVLDKGVLSLAAAMPGDKVWTPLLYAGPATNASEGAHIGIGAFEIGEATLDVFFRFLLGHLIFFRQIVPHPGFRWASLVRSSSVHYLTSMTHETDPVKREENRKRYLEDYKARFSRGQG